MTLDYTVFNNMLGIGVGLSETLSIAYSLTMTLARSVCREGYHEELLLEA